MAFEFPGKREGFVHDIATGKRVIPIAAEIQDTEVTLGDREATRAALNIPLGDTAVSDVVTSPELEDEDAQQPETHSNDRDFMALLRRIRGDRRPLEGPLVAGDEGDDAFYNYDRSILYIDKTGKKTRKYARDVKFGRVGHKVFIGDDSQDGTA